MGWSAAVPPLDPADRLVQSLDRQAFEETIGQCLKQGDGMRGGQRVMEYEVVWLARLAGLLSRLSQDETRIQADEAPDEGAFLRELLDDYAGVARSAAT